MNSNSFPLNSSAIQCFRSLKEEICKASLAAFDENAPLLVETDASATSLAATLSMHEEIMQKLKKEGKY